MLQIRPARRDRGAGGPYHPCVLAPARILLVALVLAAPASPTFAQHPGRGQHMSPEERQRLRDDMNAARRDGHREGQPRREMPPPGGRMSPEEREKLRRDMMDANRGMPRR